MSPPICPTMKTIEQLNKSKKRASIVRFHVSKKAGWLKRLALLALTAIMTISAMGNVLQNGDFEGSNLPPSHKEPDWPNFNINRFPNYWNSPTGGSPDYFNDGYNGFTCSSNGNIDNWTCFPNVCTSTNVFGAQNPRTSGNHAYVGFAPDHEYIQQGFTQLSAGACYTVGFWLSLGDLSNYDARMQVLFSYDNLQDHTHYGAMDSSYYSSDPYAYVLTDRHYSRNKTGWVHVSFSFKATGHERFMTIGIFDHDGIWDQVQQARIPIIEAYTGGAGDCGNLSSGNPCGPSYQNENNQTLYCQNSGELYYYIDDVSLDATTTQLSIDYSFNSQSISSSYTNKTIIISGNCTISGSVTLTNCEVFCNNNASITVPSGAYLHLVGASNDSTVLHAGCDLMWRGMLIGGQLELNHSCIEDAVTAVKVQDGGGWYFSNDSYFRRNDTDMIINGASSFSNYIKGTTFDHTAPLRDTALVDDYGVIGIKVKGTSSTGTITVGGTGSGERCTFLKGRYGIISDKADINMKACEFKDVGLYGIEFTNFTTGSRSLNITDSCYFKNVPLAIFSHNLTNLKVQNSDFYKCAAGINWYDNFNCDLIIGDDSSYTLGNTFTGCAYPVTCWNNRSTAANNTDLFYANDSVATNILISHNQMFGIVNMMANNINTVVTGISLNEYSAGSVTAYRTCVVSENLMTLTTTGIELNNVVGWGFAAQGNAQLSEQVPNKIENNGIGLTTAATPWARGIVIRHSSGWNVPANSISSDAPENWQNNGIYLENSENTETVGNAIVAGTGIVIAQDELYSNIHCNSLVNNSCAINLAQAALRTPGMKHGKYLSASNSWEAYNNYISTTNIPWGLPVQNYFSDTAYVKWIWDNTSTSTNPKVWNSANGAFETNKTSHSLISSTVGGDSCAFQPVYGGEIFDVPFASGSASPSSFADPVAQWVADYNYEIRRINSGQGDSLQASANIKTVIAIETAIGQRNFSTATSLMSSFSPDNTVEQNYYDVFAVLLDVNGEEISEATSSQKDALIAIAEENVNSGGLAVNLARSYLFVKYRLSFTDPDYTGDKTHGEATISSPCEITPYDQTVLSFMDDDGNELPIAGSVIQPDGSFTFDPFQMNYYSTLYSSTQFRIYAKYGSTYTVVNRDFMKLGEWLSASPIHIDLSGVAVALDTVDASPYKTIDHYIRMEDSQRNVYQIGVTSGSNSDWLIEKRTSGNSLIWSRAYDGPVSGNDTATCMYVDGQDNVYVAGKVWTGQSYDYMALKYDADGYLVWSSLLDDSLKRDNEPTGIVWDEGDNSVQVIGTCDGDYRYVQFFQCLPSSQRQAQPGPVTQNPVEFYPNPSDGKITVNLHGQPGGTLELYTLTGKLVYSQHITESGEVVLSEKAVADGVYLLKFTITNASPQVSKVIIQRNK